MGKDVSSENTLADTGHLLVKPIGYMCSKRQAKFDAPHQPNRAVQSHGVIELNPDYLLEAGLADLSGFTHIWLIWWFNRNKTWRPMVLPPRGPEKRRGVFATRSPHRPNPIGLTAVELLKIERKKIFVGSHDLIDGTPIIDIKPYIPEVDAFPEANIGWLGPVEQQLESQASYKVELSELATSQIAWLAKYKIDFIERATELLSIDPTPHRTRRITKVDNNYFRMGCGAWRLFFTVSEGKVKIEKIEPGYPLNNLVNESEQKIIDRDTQLMFYKSWLAAISR